MFPFEIQQNNSKFYTHETVVIMLSHKNGHQITKIKKKLTLCNIDEEMSKNVLVFISLFEFHAVLLLILK